jgi:hypothetical protein
MALIHLTVVVVVVQIRLDLLAERLTVALVVTECLYLLLDLL